MESANLHHQQHRLQDQLAIGSSSSSSSSLTNTTTADPSSYGVGIGNPHAWTQNITLNSAANNFNPNCNEDLINPRQKSESTLLSSSLNTSMIQDLGFHWNINPGNFNNIQTAQHLHLSKIKEELSLPDHSFPKVIEILNTQISTIDQASHGDHLSSPTYLNKDKDLNALREKLLLKTLSSAGFPIQGHQFSPGEIYSSPLYSCSFGTSNYIPSRGSFSQIYPSINISNLNQTSSSTSSRSSFDMNLQALDLLSSTNLISGDHTDLCQSPHDNLGLYQKDRLSFGLDRLQQSTAQRPPCSTKKASSYANEIAEAKRTNSFMEPKATQQSLSKKSRTESRASCPPIKVRKEKLGDRIAALQQLVAPFGKTDTASVLMEAIGYIKFLQNQVQTLSVPYMKPSRNKSTRSAMQGVWEDGNEEPIKRDLRSRGLCLVPLSCMSYITSDGGSGGDIWPPPNLGGGT